LDAKKSGKKIKFVSDKLEHYRKGFKKYFRNLAILQFGVSIKRQRKYGLKHNNNCIERDHQYSKERTKIMRHFKEIKSADELLNFFDIHYNFIDGQKLKREKKWRTPAQRAEIKINLPKRFRLLHFIHVCMGTGD
jgi:transposase-like protein